MTRIIGPNGREAEVSATFAVSVLNGSDTRYKLADGETDPRDAEPLDAERRAELQARAEEPSQFAKDRGADKNPNYAYASGPDTTAADTPEFPDPVRDVDPDAEAPAGNAAREEWVAYAETQGYDAGDLERWSRNDIRDHLTA